MLRKVCSFILIYIIFICTDSYALDTSKSSIVMDMTTGRVLYEKKSNDKRLIASTTKIMTAILAIENSDIKTKVTVGKEILNMYGTNIYLELEEEITIEDLLYGLILRSGNDAAIVLATHIGKTEENFVRMMNEKAKELGMENTIFQNPHGLDDYTENYSTAYDMALLSSYASQNKVYQKITKTKKYKTSTQNKSYTWNNRNKLLSTYRYCTGGKNGYTPKAGRTLVTTATKDNIKLTIITLNDPNEYDTHQYLYKKMYSKYKLYKLIDKNNYQISKDIYKNNYQISNDFSYLLSEEERKNVKIDVIIDKQENTQIIGYLKITLNDKIIGIVDIYENTQKKEEMNFFQKISNYLLDILKKFMLGLQNSLKPGPVVPIPLEIYKSVSLTL